MITLIDLSELLELQKELDDYILEQKNLNLTQRELMTDTLLALQVEVSELANSIRSFKHWSSKGPEKKEVILEEYVDVLHFFLSIGNQLGFKTEDIENAYLMKRQININRLNSGY